LALKKMPPMPVTLLIWTSEVGRDKRVARPPPNARAQRRAARARCGAELDLRPRPLAFFSS